MKWRAIQTVSVWNRGDGQVMMRRREDCGDESENEQDDDYMTR